MCKHLPGGGGRAPLQSRPAGLAVLSGRARTCARRQPRVPRAGGPKQPGSAICCQRPGRGSRFAGQVLPSLRSPTCLGPARGEGGGIQVFSGLQTRGPHRPSEDPPWSVCKHTCPRPPPAPGFLTPQEGKPRPWFQIHAYAVNCPICISSQISSMTFRPGNAKLRVPPSLDGISLHHLLLPSLPRLGKHHLPCLPHPAAS